MIKIQLVYDSPKQLQTFKDLNINCLVEYETFDMNEYSQRKKGLSLKRYWGAHMDPFVLISIDNKPTKAFYSEASTEYNAAEQLVQYLSDIFKPVNDNE